MGISGLLQALKPCNRPCTLAEFRGQRIGVDAYGWLHRGAIACATELCQGIPTSRYLSVVMHRVRLLRHFGVHPVLVLDGGELPVKAATEANRRANRKHHQQEGMALLRQGKRGAAEEHFQKAVDVTPEMACSLIQVLRAENVEFIVAPFEADAQLAYLARIGHIQGVVTEDSDLIALQNPCTLLKMDRFGAGVSIRFEEVVGNADAGFAQFSAEMVLRACILAGCDYLPSLPGIGVKTAQKLVRQHGSLENVLQALLTDPKSRFTARELSEYAAKFREAELTFRHHRVYDPVSRELTYLSPPPPGVDP
eukprot:RCo044963